MGVELLRGDEEGPVRVQFVRDFGGTAQKVKIYEYLILRELHSPGGLDQLADRSLRMREVPGSKPGFSILQFGARRSCRKKKSTHAQVVA